MPVVSANGLSFHVQEMGAGPPLVLIHGMLLSNMTSWYFGVAPALAASHRVFLYDLRGHGKSERMPSGYDLATMATDLGALVDQRFGSEPVALAGFSFGAGVAMRFALDHPERVRKLVLVEAPLPPHDQEETRFLMEQDRDELMRTLYPDQARQTLDALPVSRKRILAGLPPGFDKILFSGDRRLRRLLATLRFLLGESSIVDDVRSEPDFDDADLARLAAPVLCLYGKKSKIRKHGKRYARALPEVRVELLPGSHYLLDDSPREVAAAMLRFLDDSEPADG